MEKPEMDAEFWSELAEYNPLGMSLTEQDARDWFDYVWLRFKAAGYTKRGARRAIVSWWSRVREYEIEASRGRAERIREDAEVDALMTLRDAPGPETVVVDYASEVLKRGRR